MSREIKFRGLRVDGKGWVIGSYNTDNSIFYEILCNDGGDWDVIPESVGQFIGLKNINDVDIYNGDKLLFNGYISNVVYNVGNARFEAHGEKHTVPAHKFKLCEIVGNIHENKD